MLRAFEKDGNILFNTTFHTIYTETKLNWVVVLDWLVAPFKMLHQSIERGSFSNSW